MNGCPGEGFRRIRSKNEKWDDEFHKIEDPSVEQEEEIEQELPEDDWQQGKGARAGAAGG